jgi:hypothetical protein
LGEANYSFEVRHVDLGTGVDYLDRQLPEAILDTDAVSTNGDLLVIRYKRRHSQLIPPCNWFEFVRLDGANSAIDNPHPGSVTDCPTTYPWLGAPSLTEGLLYWVEQGWYIVESGPQLQVLDLTTGKQIGMAVGRPAVSYSPEGMSDMFHGHVAPYMAAAQDGTVALWNTTPSNEPVNVWQPQLQDAELTATRIMPELEAAAPWSEECQCNSSPALASLYITPIDLPDEARLTP